MVRKKLSIARILLFTLLVLILLLVIVYCIRFFSPRQLDDVNPLIECSGELLDKSDVLMVIPMYKNVSIAENKAWCEWILSLNKSLGMHGVYHTYNEFSYSRDEEYINIGREEFKKCFGFYPSIFEAPQVALNRDNERLLKQIGFEARGWPNMFFRKVYHCQDNGEYAIHLFWKFRITNKLIDFI